ncbi:MAG: low molecular weight protein-tyrosine-phosphatase [Planctomycetota bacterium]
MPRVLMVCLGNICRSPAAEAVLRSTLEQEGLADGVHVDSAGTIGYHAGDPADARMRAAGSARGYALTSIARRVTDEDFHDFDLIIAMDRANLRDLQARADGPAEIVMLGEFVPGEGVPEVPDPYYGGDDGFERVLDLIESAMPALVAKLQEMA